MTEPPRWSIQPVSVNEARRSTKTKETPAKPGLELQVETIRWSGRWSGLQALAASGVGLSTGRASEWSGRSDPSLVRHFATDDFRIRSTEYFIALTVVTTANPTQSTAAVIRPQPEENAVIVQSGAKNCDMLTGCTRTSRDGISTIRSCVGTLDANATEHGVRSYWPL
jgi:hypothetical protein